MAVKIITFLLSLFLSTICVRNNLGGPTHGKVVVCYVKPQHDTFTKIFTDKTLPLCTHLVIENGYIDITDYTIALSYKNTTQLVDFISATKKSQPHLKVTISIKVGYEINIFSAPPNQTTREQVIESTIRRIREYDLDGVDLYVPHFPEAYEEAENLVLLAQNLKETLVFSYKHLVTATFIGRSNLVTFINVLVYLSRYLDLIHITNLNVIKTSRGLEHALAPLKGNNQSDDSSVEFIIKRLLANGVKPVKLVLLLDLDPHFYLLSNPKIKDIRLENLAVVHYIIHTTNEMDLYYWICIEQYFTGGELSWVSHWSDYFSARYLQRDNFIVFSENPRSIVAKVKMGIDYGLKGFAVRSENYTSCSSPNDTYLDFIERYNQLKEDPQLVEKLKDLDLPNADNLGNKSYGVSNDTLYLQVPKEESNFFVIVNEAITISIEEKKIFDALKTNSQKQKPLCIFWPICAAPISVTTPATITSDKKAVRQLV